MINDLSSRSELKENVLASKLEGVVKWALENRTKVLTAGGLLLAGILISSVLIIRRQQELDLSTTRLGQAQALIGQKQYPQARQILEDIKSTQPNSSVGQYAEYNLGEMALEEKNYDEAIQHYSSIVDKSSSKAIKPLALANLGFAYEQKKDYPQALKTYQKFMEQFAEHFMAPRIQLAVGRTAMLAGDKDTAKKSFGQLIDLYPTSEWAQNARRLLDNIDTR